MSVDKDIKKLIELLKKLYIETKLEKFYNDAIELEQYIWTLSDKTKKDLNINISGSYDAKDIKKLKNVFQD
jgi:hypothetical protein